MPDNVGWLSEGLARILVPVLSCNCLFLEPVCLVWTSGGKKRVQAGDRVSDKEDRAPAFVLLNMDEFMYTQAFEFPLADPEDYVAQRDS